MHALTLFIGPVMYLYTSHGIYIVKLTNTACNMSTNFYTITTCNVYPLFQSLCRDLEKENTKTWLDMMLEKISSHSAEGEDGLSGRDKAVKAQEKKKLETMIERHNGLMAPTIEAQSRSYLIRC